MSRSRKKVFGGKDRSPFYKNQANRRVRRFEDSIPNGGSYKKLYEQWNICDYKCIWFVKEDLNDYLNRLNKKDKLYKYFNK